MKRSKMQVCFLCFMLMVFILSLVSCVGGDNLIPVTEGFKGRTNLLTDHCYGYIEVEGKEYPLCSVVGYLTITPGTCYDMELNQPLRITLYKRSSGTDIADLYKSPGEQICFPDARYIQPDISYSAMPQ